MINKRLNSANACAVTIWFDGGTRISPPQVLSIEVACSAGLIHWLDR